jgi:LuxR family maltose regulon positive regulatory protein
MGNQAKARYCYLTNNYPPLLAYIEEQKKREAVLYGRIEMLAMEACIHYKMKDKKKACAVLAEAYNAASPNDIVMPFIELGKDMRTLTSFALKEPHKAIPKNWLEAVNRKSATYAKRLVHAAAEYKRANNISDDIAISPREHEILADLAHGLSRAEIAASRRLSINTVKMVINNVFMKLGAENLADAIRIATEKKII